MSFRKCRVCAISSVLKNAELLTLELVDVPGLIMTMMMMITMMTTAILTTTTIMSSLEWMEYRCKFQTFHFHLKILWVVKILQEIKVKE